MTPGATGERAAGRAGATVLRPRSRLAGALLVLAAITVATAVGSAVLAIVAATIPVPWVFVTGGMVAFLVVDLAGSAWIAHRRAPPLRRRRARWVIAGLTAPPLLGAFAVTALIPPPSADAGAGVSLHPEQHLVLATGSRLAVVRLPARNAARLPPIIVLHGGPGIPDLAGSARSYSRLTGLGADVYLYAQLGTDTSTRLPDSRGYGRDRDVADLEALRARLGLDRVTLLGHSYGGALAAAYLAAHPERVSRLVLVSPGALDPADTSGARATARLAPAQRLRLYTRLLAPRALLGYGLLQINPVAAHAFMDDREADARNDEVVALGSPGLHCPGAPPDPPTAGSGFYAMEYPQSVTAKPPADPRAALTGLPTPTLIVKGSCDYLSWSSALAYRDRLPRSQLIYLPGAGHNVGQDRPDDLLATVAAFLQGRPPARAPIVGDRVPADYSGPA